MTVTLNQSNATALAPALWQQLRACAQALRAVRQGKNHTQALALVEPRLRAGAQALLFAVLRQWGRATAIKSQLVSRAPKPAVDDLLCVGLGLALQAEAMYPMHTLVNQLVEAAKKSPFSYASSGIGTTTHLSMERLKSAAKVDIVHVPYQPAAAINAVVAGHTQIASTSMPPAVPMIKAGKLKALAVTSATRSPLLPDVPSITEFGYKEFDDYTWFGFFAPAGTPPAVIEKLNAALNRAMESQDVVDKFAQLGMSSSRNSAAEFGSFLRAEVPKWAAVVKSSGAKAD